MFDYKLSGSILVFSLLVTMTGSIVTLEDWEDLNTRQKIEIIENNTELNTDEKGLLTDMLVTGENPAKMKKLFSDKAKELRLEASKSVNPIKIIKLKDGAESFEKSLKQLSRIRSYENSLRGLRLRYANSNHDPRIKDSIERSINELLGDYEREKGELKLTLVQGFLAVKAAKNTEQILEQNQGKITETKPTVEDLGFFGPITLFIGFLASIIAGLKLLVDYRKSKIDLKLAQLKVQESQSK